MAAKSRFQIRKRSKIPPRERLDVSWVLRSKRRPTVSSQTQLGCGHGQRLVDQRRHLRRVELAKTAERFDAGKRIYADHAEACVGNPGACEPIQELQQLKLVKQIVLKPERDLSISGRGRQMLVPEAKAAQHLIVVQRRPGEMSSPDLRCSSEVEARREGPFDHRVAPRQYIVVGKELLQRVRRRVTIRNVKA